MVNKTRKEIWDILEGFPSTEELLVPNDWTKVAAVFVSCHNLEYFEDYILDDLLQIIGDSYINDIYFVKDLRVLSNKVKARVLVDIVSPKAIPIKEEDIEEFVGICKKDPCTEHYAVVFTDVAGNGESKFKPLYEEYMWVIEKNVLYLQKQKITRRML